MKYPCLFTLVFIWFNLNGHAEEISQVYPGKLLNKDLISTESDPVIDLKFKGTENGFLAFKFRHLDRVTIKEIPIFEKLVLVRIKGANNEPGEQRLVPDEFIHGDIIVREEIIDNGPVASEDFMYLGVTTRTDLKGILLDDREKILSLFEDLQHQSSTLQFANKRLGIQELTLTRAQIYQELGIFYESRINSREENLSIGGVLDQATYAPGDTAKLSVSARNEGDEGVVYRVLARSVSRWEWLDGKMFYLGDINAGEKKLFSRFFPIPDDTAEGDYYLRIGGNEYSGAKPQHRMIFKIRK